MFLFGEKDPGRKQAGVLFLTPIPICISRVIPQAYINTPSSP